MRSVTLGRRLLLRAEEALGRSVMSSKYARRARGSGVIHPWVFLERLDAPSVSVDRLDHASSAVMAQVGGPSRQLACRPRPEARAPWVGRGPYVRGRWGNR